MTSIAYLNGAYLPLAQAQVSVLDRGFLFADGVYEVAAAELDLALPVGLDDIAVIQTELVRRNALGEGLVYLQLTRGADPARDFLPDPAIAPTLVLFVQPKALVDVPAARTGIAVKSVADLRWARRDIKSVALLAQVLAKREAAAAGCQEAWMVEDGLVTEGASSTAFILTPENMLVTRPHSHAVLPGCTAAALEALVGEHGLSLARRSFTLAEALTAREAFISSASSFVMPVIAIDGQAIGKGRPGPVATRLRALYIDFARNV